VCSSDLAGGERVDLGLRDHRHGIEVEGVEALAGEQAGLPEMAFDAPSAALGELVLDEGCEEARGGPALGVGPLGEALPEPVDRRQPQIGDRRTTCSATASVVPARGTTRARWKPW